MKKKDVSILVVNGGKDPLGGKWLSLFTKKIYEHTDRDKFELLVWNNNVEDTNVIKLQEEYNFTLIEPFKNDSMFHPHAVPLQRLFNTAVNKFQSKYIIIMDSDAFPIKKGWFEILINAISSGEYLLAGIWRDELIEGIRPYIHPSCMCFSSSFVLSNKLRLDFFGENLNGINHDTLSSFTDKALFLRGKMLKWKRSNKNNFHRLMGGVYGNYVYHHGAGSRKNIGFWDEGFDSQKSLLYNKLNQESSRLLFADFENYIDWLIGEGNLNFTRVFDNVDLDDNEYDDDSKNSIKDAKVWRKVKALKKKILSQKEVANKTQKQTFDNMRGLPSIGLINELEKPKGWYESFPDIVGLGVPKAGTSWWFDLILKHPDIIPHRFYNKTSDTSKELNFFSHFGYEEITNEEKELYKSCFIKQEGLLCGEFSTIYLSHLGSLKNLLNTIPENTVLVIILRNPVDRFVSHINHVMRNRARLLDIDDADLDLFKKYSVFPEAQLYSLYSDVIKYLFKNTKNRIFVDTYENIVSNPKKAIERFSTFLGLHFGHSLNIDFSKKKNTQPYVVSIPNTEKREVIAEYFKEDVVRLKNILPDIDFSNWKEFN